MAEKGLVALLNIAYKLSVLTKPTVNVDMADVGVFFLFFRASYLTSDSVLRKCQVVSG